MRTFRFGAQVYTAASASAWFDTVRTVEALGYSSLLVPDHFSDQLGPWVALTAAALTAPTLRIGTLVIDNDFRNPVELAKEAATLDLLSGGRLELGLGAGWALYDYERSGIPYDAPKVRIDRFEEALTILKGLFGDDPVTFTGDHYKITGTDGQPKPVQRPHPKLMIGGGRRRMLSIAARHADIVNVTYTMRSGEWDDAASKTGTADATAEKIRWVREAAGDRFDALELGVPVFDAEITGDRKEAAERLAHEYGLTVDEVLGSPHMLVGSVESIVDELEQRREQHGISYIVIGRGAYEPLAPVVAKLAGT